MGTRAERRLTENVLLALDTVAAHRETWPKREPFERALSSKHGYDFDASLGSLAGQIAEWRRWVVEGSPAYGEIAAIGGSPEYAAQVFALEASLISATLDAWQHGRGARPTGLGPAPTKMGAVVELLAALGISRTEGTLTTLWSRLCKAGRPTWRSDEWFLSWGAKRRSSDWH
jgi:hypothetical protein